MNDQATNAAASSEQTAALQGLHHTLHDLWQFGGNALIGWKPTNAGIEVLTVPKIRLFNTSFLPRRVFAGNRLMGQHSFTEISDAFGIQPIELRLAMPVGDGADRLSTASVDSVFQNFAVTKSDHHAVILLDIVGFSTYSPEEQASQLATLEFALNVATEVAREKGFPIDAARSTTGDGFYVWNQQKGSEADINLFVMLAMFLTYHSTLRQRATVAAAVPTIRTAVSIGSHYSYQQPGRDMVRGAEYIVGDVTISVARLIGKCRANQIVIGDIHRPDDQTNEMLSAEAFVSRVAQRLEQITDLVIFGNRLRRFAFYLTGPRQADGSFRSQKLRIVDKHGFEHFGYNGKLNIFLDGDATYYCGLQHADLFGKPAPAAPAAQS